MQPSPYFRISLGLAILFFFTIAVVPALAKKPHWAGNDKGGQRYDKQMDDRRDGGDRKAYRPSGLEQRSSRHFNTHHHVVINNYYVEQFRSGGCPPGLRKKGNGCLPPGQAKKWRYGRPLPRDVIYYDLPPAILLELGPAPRGYKFVRVAQDILMIAVGTGMVIDAIENIGRVVD